MKLLCSAAASTIFRPAVLSLAVARYLSIKSSCSAADIIEVASHVARYCVCRTLLASLLSFLPSNTSFIIPTMPLIELRSGKDGWYHVKYAAVVLDKASQFPDVNDLQAELRNYFQNAELTTIDIHTGLHINRYRKTILVHNYRTIVIAFQGSGDDEIHLNLWINGKGPNWWELPYPVHVNGDRVHSFYLDMWNGMKDAIFSGLGNAIAKMREQDIVPGKVIVAGFSMGGGVSTLGFTEIIEHIRHTYGSQNASPQDWACDHNLGSLVPHYTFASQGAGDHGYLTKLNQIYERYHIRAWDFLNHWDKTLFLPPYDFRCWRGHRYILPDSVTHQFTGSFGPQGHSMKGYYEAAEWMAEDGGDQVKSAYHYT